MAEKFDIPEFLKITDADRTRQKVLRGQNASLLQLQKAEQKIAFHEKDAQLATDTLAMLLDTGADESLVNVQRRRLAINLKYLGEFEQALSIAPDEQTRTEVEAMRLASEIPDYLTCGCDQDRDKRHGFAVENMNVVTHIRRNGAIVPAVVCSKCRFMNAGGKPSKRVDDSKNRNPATHAHFVNRLHSRGR